MLKSILINLSWFCLLTCIDGQDSCDDIKNRTLCHNFMDNECIWCYNSTNGICLNSNYCRNYNNYNCTIINNKQQVCSFLTFFYLFISLVFMGVGTCIIVGLMILYYYPNKQLTFVNKYLMGCSGVLIMICNIIFLYFHHNYFEKYLVVLAGVVLALLILLWINKGESGSRYYGI